VRCEAKQICDRDLLYRMDLDYRITELPGKIRQRQDRTRETVQWTETGQDRTGRDRDRDTHNSNHEQIKSNRIRYTTKDKKAGHNKNEGSTSSRAEQQTGTKKEESEGTQNNEKSKIKNQKSKISNQQK